MPRRVSLERAIFSLALALSGLSCAEHAATEVMIQLYVEPELASLATRLHVTVENDEGQQVLDQAKLLSGESGRIARIPLVPKGEDPARRFVVRAELFDAADALRGRVEAHAGYRQDELRTLNLWFEADCLDKVCSSGRTCQAGACRGGCFETQSAEATLASRPSCKECEQCAGRCAPADGVDCGCPGDSCAASECVPKDRVAFVGAGYYHSCASLSTGAVYCWGLDHGYGRLGIGANQNATSPSLVPDALGTDGLVVSGSHSCALTPDTRYCWGQNDLGQLGNSEQSSAEPFPVAMDNTALGLTALTTGFQHTCGLAQDAIWCWGHNETGELGLGMASEPQLSPVRVATGFARVSAGGAHTCGLKTDGQLECWGLNESLEVGVAAGRVVPGALRSGCDANGAGRSCFSDWTAVGAGGFHTCAIRQGGDLYCWGGNRDGQLGIGPLVTSEDFVEPQRVASEVLWSEVAAGLHFSCGLDQQGVLYCWGRNESHQLGLPQAGTVWTPTRVDVDAPAGFRLLSLGENHACAIRADRTLWCWGRNVEGQVGIGLSSETPIEVPTRVCF